MPGNKERRPEGAPPATPPKVCHHHIAALRRRRDAAHRSEELDCGCRDPWPCRCTDPPLSENALDGYRAAALHILNGGATPLLPIEVRRALWRRGSDDRKLAELLHKACGGVAT